MGTLRRYIVDADLFVRRDAPFRLSVDRELAPARGHNTAIYDGDITASIAATQSLH